MKNESIMVSTTCSEIRWLDFLYHGLFAPLVPFVPFVPWTIRTIVGLFIPFLYHVSQLFALSINNRNRCVPKHWNHYVSLWKSPVRWACGLWFLMIAILLFFTLVRKCIFVSSAVGLFSADCLRRPNYADKTLSTDIFDYDLSLCMPFCLILGWGCFGGSGSFSPSHRWNKNYTQS